MNHTPVDLLPLLCAGCGRTLPGGDESALFLCEECGLVHEPVGALSSRDAAAGSAAAVTGGNSGLESFPALSAAVTTKLKVPQDVRYLAAWRLKAPTWRRIKRAAAPGDGYVYVPAFSLIRPVVQRLGVSLSVFQPDLELSPGFPGQTAARPALVEVDGDTGASPEGPGFGAVSPVVVSRQDARVLAQFVHLAVESHEGQIHDLLPVGADLPLEGEELIFIPAVWDPRYIQESNWRLLLSEFDGLVA